MGKAGKDLRPALEAIGAVGKARIFLCFNRGEDPYGDKWPELKSREGQPLRKSGRLQRSYTYHVTKDGVVWGSNTRYASVHHFGAEIEAKEAYSIKKHQSEKREGFPHQDAERKSHFPKIVSPPPHSGVQDWPPLDLCDESDHPRPASLAGQGSGIAGRLVAGHDQNS